MVKPVRFFSLILLATPRRPVLAGILLLLTAGSGLSLVNPWLAGEVTADVLAGASDGSLAWLLVLWFIILGCNAFIQFAATWAMGSVSERICASIRELFMEHCYNLPVSFFYETNVGDLLAYISSDIEVVGRFVTTEVLPAIPALLLLVAVVILMWQLSWQITTLAVLLLPLYFIAVKLVGRRLRPTSREWIQAYADLLSFVEQRLGNITLFKVYSTDETEKAAHKVHDQRFVQLALRQHRVQAALSPMTMVLAGLGLMLIIWFGTVEIQRGTLTTPALVSLMLYANLLRGALARLANVYGEVQQTLGAADRLINLFNQAEEVTDGEPLTADTADLSIRGLTFRYQAPLLDDINLQVRAGETVALTGNNGSGKTTLAFLIMGLIRPQPGEIFIGDQDLASVSPMSLRAHVGLITQNTLLLNSSVGQNIAVSEHYDHDRVRKAAQLVGADSFIEALPATYETHIGSQGLKLSGGQRQRIALARVVYKDASLLVLDEPTSLFDQHSELEFMDIYERIFRGRTVILITHSTRLLQLADRVVALSDGKLEDIDFLEAQIN